MRRVASGIVLAFGVLTVQSFVHAQEQAEVPVVRDTFSVKAGGASYVKFNLPTYYRDGRIAGNALASGGSGNEIRVLLLTEQQFPAWQAEPLPLYDSGQRQSVVLGVPVSDAGTYYIVFDNRFSTLSSKNVQADIRFVHRGVDTRRAEDIRRQELAILEQSIKQLEDPDWKNRSAAFEKLMGAGTIVMNTRDVLPYLFQKWPEKSEDITLAVVKLLGRENRVAKEQNELFLQRCAKNSSYCSRPLPEAEGRSEYYAYLIMAVTGLKDPRAVDALLGAINTGNMATSALAAFGDAALDRVLEVFNTSDGTSRQSAGSVLAEMLDAKNASKVRDPRSRQ